MHCWEFSSKFRCKGRELDFKSDVCWYKNKNIENTWLKMNSKVKKNQTEKELDIEKSFFVLVSVIRRLQCSDRCWKKLGKEIWLKKEERKHRLTFLPKLKWVMQASKYIVCVRCDCFALLVKTPLWSILEKFVQLYNIYFHKI